MQKLDKQSAKVMDMGNIEELLVAAYKENRFLDYISDELDINYEERAEFAEQLTRLHNDGLIDLIKIFNTIENKQETHYDFFLIRDLFCKALPHINAPVVQVMECVQHLIKTAGNDMTSGMVLSPYTDFCTADTSRPIESLKHVELSKDEYSIFLSPSIVAGTRGDLPSYVGKAVKYTKHEDIAIRRQAVFVLGNIKYEGSDISIETAFKALESSCLEELDDQLLANVINSAATLLGYNYKGLPEEWNTVLLNNLQQVELKHKGSISALDAGLARLVGKKQTQSLALEFIEKYLQKHRSSEIADLFSGLSRKFLKDKELLATVVTSWLLKGDIALCEFIFYVIGTVHGDNFELSIDASVVSNKDPADIIFLAHKIIGYLFTYQITAASLLLSLLRYTIEMSSSEELTELLFDPLLLNYPGSVKTYLESQQEEQSPEIAKVIRQLLERLETYFDGLHSAENISELHPPQSHREAYRRQQIREHSKITEEADKKSIFSSIFSTVNLLYGHKSINYMHGPDGKSNRQVMPLHSHSVQMELPFTERFDPFGVNYKLRIFRYERSAK